MCKVIDQILRSFLWHGAVGISKAAKVLGRSLPPERGRKGVLASREFMIGIRQLLPDICGTLPLTHIPSGLPELIVTS